MVNPSEPIDPYSVVTQSTDPCDDSKPSPVAANALRELHAVSRFANEVARGHSVPDERILGEVRRLISTMPSGECFTPKERDAAIWLGEASATLRMWNTVRGGSFAIIASVIGSPIDDGREPEYQLTALLHEARRDLELKCDRGTAVQIEAGQTFEYFEQLRELIQGARADLLLVDRHMDHEFVARYLPYVAAGTAVRLLTRDKTAQLLPAVDAFVS